MKKIIICIILLVLLPCMSGIQPQLFAQQKDHHNRSKQIIDRYNRLRIKRSLPGIQHDTILDNIAGEIQSNRKYRKSRNLYNEETIREVLYKNGITDYQYEIMEFPDKDMTSAFTTFLLNDVFSNIRVGYSKVNNQNILLKTKSFLKFDHGEISCHSPVIDGLHSKSTSTTVDVITDNAKVYMKSLKKGTYSYYTTDSIPLKSYRPIISTKKPSIVKPKGKLSAKETYDLVFTLRNNECNKYLVIVNEINEIVSILK